MGPLLSTCGGSAVTVGDIGLSKVGPRVRHLLSKVGPPVSIFRASTLQEGASGVNCRAVGVKPCQRGLISLLILERRVEGLQKVLPKLSTRLSPEAPPDFEFSVEGFGLRIQGLRFRGDV